MRNLLALLLTILTLSCTTSDDSNTNTTEPDTAENTRLITEIYNYNGELREKIINKDNKPFQYFLHSGWNGSGNNIWDGYQIQYNSRNMVKYIYSEEIRTNGEEENWEELGETIFSDENLLIEYFYDSNNQLSMIERLNYGRERLLFEYNNDKISTITVQEDYGSGYDSRRKFHFKYDENDNIVESKLEYLQFEGETIMNYRYDTQMNPFHSYYAVNGLIGFLEPSGVDQFVSYLSKNKPMGPVSYSEDVTYTYGQDGFPIIIHYKSDNVPRTTKIKYED